MKEKGFTLIEILLTIIIFAFLILATILFFQKGTEAWVRSQPYLRAQEMARKAFYGEIGSQLGMIRELRAADWIDTSALPGSAIRFRRGIIDGGNRRCETTADTTEVQVFPNSSPLPARGLTVVAPQRGQSLVTWPPDDDRRAIIRYRLDPTNNTDLIREVQVFTQSASFPFKKDKDFNLNNTDDGIIATDVNNLTFGAITDDTLTITIDMGIDNRGDYAYDDIKTFSTTITLPNM